MQVAEASKEATTSLRVVTWRRRIPLRLPCHRRSRSSTCHKSTPMARTAPPRSTCGVVPRGRVGRSGHAAEGRMSHAVARSAQWLARHKPHRTPRSSTPPKRSPNWSSGSSLLLLPPFVVVFLVRGPSPLVAFTFFFFLLSSFSFLVKYKLANVLLSTERREEEKKRHSPLPFLSLPLPSLSE